MIYEKVLDILTYSKNNEWIRFEERKETKETIYRKDVNLRIIRKQFIEKHIVPWLSSIPNEANVYSYEVYYNNSLIYYQNFLELSNSTIIPFPDYEVIPKIDKIDANIARLIDPSGDCDEFIERGKYIIK